MTVDATGKALRIVAPAAYVDAGAPVASRYAWGAVPMMSAYDKETDLPVIPWNEKAASSTTHVIV